MATFETILSMKKNSRFSYRCLVRFERRNNCGLGWPKLLSLLLYVDNARLVADVSSLWTLFTRNAWGGCAESAGTTESVTTISCNGRPRSTLLYLVLPTHFSVHACGLARCHYLYYSYWSLHLFSAGWIIATVCWSTCRLISSSVCNPFRMQQPGSFATWGDLNICTDQSSLASRFRADRFQGIATLTFRALHGTAPPYMTSQFTRVADNV